MRFNNEASYPIYKGITSALIKGEYSYMHVLP